jgi:hypothetical protein
MDPIQQDHFDYVFVGYKSGETIRDGNLKKYKIVEQSLKPETIIKYNSTITLKCKKTNAAREKEKKARAAAKAKAEKEAQEERKREGCDLHELVYVHKHRPPFRGQNALYSNRGLTAIYRRSQASVGQCFLHYGKAVR